MKPWREVLVYILLALSFVATSGVGAYAWARRRSPGVRALAFVAFWEITWIVGYVLELTSPTVAAKVLWDDLQFPGSLFAPIAELFFALGYCGLLPSRPRRLLALLGAPPVLFLALLATNRWHGLARGAAWIEPGIVFDSLRYDYPVAMWVAFVYVILVTLAGMVLFARSILTHQRLYRAQRILLVTGFSLPTLSGLAAVLGVTVLGQRDITPFFMGIGNVLLAVGLFRYRLLDIAPIARSAVIDSLGDVVIVLDDRSRVIDLNPAACAELGVTPEGTIGMPVEHLLGRQPPVVERFRGVMEARDEISLVDKGGRVRHYDVSIFPVRDRRGFVAGRAVLARDVGRRVEAEKQLRAAHDDLERRVRERTEELAAANQSLRESEARYRVVVESFPDMILVSDYRGRMLYVNPSMERQTGMTLADFQAGVPSTLTVHPEDVERVGRETSELLRSDREMSGLIENRVILNGKVLWRSGIICKISYQGRPALMIISRDVTAEKEAAIERERLIVDLEAKNAELERFAYTVSHDLKAPLITISGFLGHLERAAAAGDDVRFSDDRRRIEEAVQKMHRMLNELLELSRVGRLANPPQTVPFAEIAREAVALARGRLEARGVEVTIAEGLPEVRGDRPRLVEMLQNLLDNAAKFMGPQQRPRVEIGARADGPGGPAFHVRDNGAGIAAEFHERIFGLFTRLDPSVEGSGIGLALVRRIVEVHGGRIWVESEGVGKGSAFCFTLPGR